MAKKKLKKLRVHNAQIKQASNGALSVNPPVILTPPRDDEPMLQSKYHRTKIANNSQVFPGVDRRTWYGRRLHESYNAIVSDMGGDDNMSFLEHALAKSLASMIGVCESIARNKAIEEHCKEEELELPDNHEAYDPLLHITVVRTVTTTAKVIGLRRRTKEVEKPDLDQYMKKTKKRGRGRPRKVIDLESERL